MGAGGGAEPKGAARDRPRALAMPWVLFIVFRREVVVMVVVVVVRSEVVVLLRSVVLWWLCQHLSWFACGDCCSVPCKTTLLMDGVHRRASYTWTASPFPESEPKELKQPRLTSCGESCVGYRPEPKERKAARSQM